MSEVYYERILDETIEKRLKMVGAVVIEGSKWCGKTTTAKQHAKSILQLQVVADYTDQRAWQRRAWVNITGSGRFSSDRTISDYAREVWKIDPEPIA